MVAPSPRSADGDDHGHEERGEQRGEGEREVQGVRAAGVDVAVAGGERQEDGGGAVGGERGQRGGGEGAGPRRHEQGDGGRQHLRRRGQEQQLGPGAQEP